MSCPGRGPTVIVPWSMLGDPNVLSFLNGVWYICCNKTLNYEHIETVVLFFESLYPGMSLLEGKSEDSKSEADDINKEKPVEKEKEEEMSDFHKLLVLRMLRPDRLHYALSEYVSKHMPARETQPVSYDQLKTYVSSHNLATMIVLPTSNTCVHSTTKIDLDIGSILDRAAQVI